MDRESIITELENQRDGLEQAISALRGAKVKSKRRMSKTARAALSKRMKGFWAAKKRVKK